MAIPTPNENEEGFSDRSFLKNVPPPNKSLPPPNVADVNFLGGASQQGQVIITDFSEFIVFIYF